MKLFLDLGYVDYALLIFRYINSPDTFCVNAAIKGYGCSSVPRQAVVLYFEMLSNGFCPNGFTFSSLISSCGKMGCLELGQKCHGQAFKNGVDGLLPVQNSLIHMYGSCGLVEVARKVLHEMPVKDIVSWNSIIDVHAKIGDLGTAHQLFDAMSHKNLVTWNIMIVGYLNGGNPGCGLKLFRNMVGAGVGGNDATMVTALTACGRSARLKEGRSVHGSLIKKFVDLSLIIGTTLIDMYSKCKRADVALVVFDRMRIKNLVCWNTMILGHCIHGNPEHGLSLYSKMVDKCRLEHWKIDFDKFKRQDGGRGILPDEITFVGVLCACARKGLLAEGRNYFNQMTDVFKVKPNFAHYWCMANLFASFGLMQEAMEMLRNMPVEADVSSESSLWAGLLGSCRFQGDVAMGELIAKALIEEDPQNGSYYALLLIVYSVAGRWDDVARIKDIIKEIGIRKMPGCSLLDLTEMVHGLKVGHKWQQVIPVISTRIGELTIVDQ